jgi:hypothetical protein
MLARSKQGQVTTPKASKPLSTRNQSQLNVSGVGDFVDETFNMKAKIVLLEQDIERRQESYIERERKYKQRIDDLEEEFNRQKTDKSGWMKTDAKMSSLKQMQHQIVGNIENVQDRTAHILQEQERDLLRAFRARLFDVQSELEKEKGKKR